MANSRRDLLTWQRDGETHALHYGRRAKPVLHVVPDKTYPGMWRVQFPDGSLSDLGNLTRVRDAACSIASEIIRQPQNGAQSPQEARAMSQAEVEATTLAPAPENESITALSSLAA